MRFGDLSDYDLWVIGLLWPSLCVRSLTEVFWIYLMLRLILTQYMTI